MAQVRTHRGAPFSPLPRSGHESEQTYVRWKWPHAIVHASAMSSISKPHLDAASAERLGREIRRRRSELGLSQAELGKPFTRGFVSAVEGGQCVPSLSALVLLAQRLNTTGGDLLAAVNPSLAPVYTRRRATGQNGVSTEGRL